MHTNNTIKSFQDLIVYQNLFQAMILVHEKIVPFLPKDEKYDLADQMKRASKSAPALIAEGFAKRYQERQWQKYINDTIGECNEMIHHLSVCISIYNRYIKVEECNKIIEIYNISCKQLTKLGQSWQNYHKKKKS
ncbi:MAG: four helix bundle protein [Patescibacteria group bacterium]